MQKPPRYIGLTGFGSNAEVKEVLARRKEGGDQKNLIMIGVLASDKSLAGETLDQPKRYPSPEALGSIFPDDQDVLNLLHVNAKQEAFLATMLQARELAGPRCHGIQLNRTRPDPEIFQEYLRHYPGDTLVLQCGSKALSQIRSSTLLNAKVAEYKGLAKYVLIDKSGGTGVPFDTDEAQRCFEALLDLPFGLGIAGGLNSERLRSLYKLRQFGQFSIDAETGIRDSEDTFDTRIAGIFLEVAEQVFARIDNAQKSPQLQAAAV